MSGAVWVAIYL